MDTEGDLPPWRILLPHGDRPPWRPEVKAPPTRAQYSEYAMAQDEKDVYAMRSSEKERIEERLKKVLQRIEDKIDAESLTAQRLEKKIDKVDNMIDDVIRNQRTATQKSSCWMCLQGYILVYK